MATFIRAQIIEELKIGEACFFVYLATSRILVGLSYIRMSLRKEPGAIAHAMPHHSYGAVVSDNDAAYRFGPALLHASVPLFRNSFRVDAAGRCSLSDSDCTGIVLMLVVEVPKSA